MADDPKLISQLDPTTTLGANDDFAVQKDGEVVVKKISTANLRKLFTGSRGISNTDLQNGLLRLAAAIASFPNNETFGLAVSGTGQLKLQAESGGSIALGDAQLNEDRILVTMPGGQAKIAFAAGVKNTIGSFTDDQELVSKLYADSRAGFTKAQTVDTVDPVELDLKNEAFSLFYLNASSATSINLDLENVPTDFYAHFALAIQMTQTPTTELEIVMDGAYTNIYEGAVITRIDIASAINDTFLLRGTVTPLVISGKQVVIWDNLPRAVAVIDSNATLLYGQETALVDASAASVTITLPNVGIPKNTAFRIKKTDATANVVQLGVQGGGDIDGNKSFNITTQNESYTFVFDGTDYFVF